MARSKCAACGHHEFEAIPVVTRGGQRFCLVQCVACGTVVGALDDVKVASVVRKAERKLNSFMERFTRGAVAMRSSNRNSSGEENS